jgi:type I restriction enzyme S subunit
MSEKMLVGKAINFNPTESIKKGSVAKKIPMGYLKEFQRKINGFESETYNSGPKFRNNDTLLAKITPCLENGKTAFVDILEKDEIAFGSSEFIVLRSTEYTTPLFVYYFARSPLFRERAISAMEGTSGRKRVNENTLKNLKINFPDIQTQQSIAKVLSDLDYKIELNNKINKELESMAKTLYDYWFVQFDFPNEDGKPYKSSGGKMVYNNELKREIPEGWEVKKLGDIIKKYADKSTHIESKNILNEGSYPVITQDNGDLISGFTNENNPIEDVPLIVFGDHSCTLRYIDFPFFRGADGTQIMYFEEDLTIYVYLFLQMIITQIPGYGKYERHYKYLKEFNIIIPKAKFLSEFQKIVEPIFNKISKSRLQNQHLTTLRDWLLPMLMNGQVTVKDVEHK